MIDLGHNLLGHILGYGRGSTDKQVATVHVQKFNVEKWVQGEQAAGRLRGYAWGGWFQDKATTSKIPWFERPGGQEMILNAQSGDIIVVAISDRAIRSNIDACRCIEHMDAFGLKVKFLDNPMIDTTTIDGQMVFQILSSVAERERKMISHRTKERYAWARQNGMPINGKAPPGWKVVRETNGLPRWAPDPQERRMAEFIVKLRDVEGMTWEGLIIYLFKNKYRNKKGREYSYCWCRDAYFACKRGFPHPSILRLERYEVEKEREQRKLEKMKKRLDKR